MLDWFGLEDWFSLLALAFILKFIGERMAGSNHAIRIRTRWFAAIGFLLYSGIAIDVWGLPNPSAVALFEVRALLASAVAYGVGLILFSIISGLWSVVYNRLIASKAWFLKVHRLLPRLPKKKPAKVAPPPPPPPRPPPPTLEERTESAWNRYQRRLQLIEKANLDSNEELSAKEKAKQTYLREIEDVIT